MRKTYDNIKDCFVHQTFTNYVHGYDRARKVHANGVTCARKFVYGIFFFFFFFTGPFTNHTTAGEGRGHFCNSSVPLPPASQTLRHKSGDYWRELPSAHS